MSIGSKCGPTIILRVGTIGYGTHYFLFMSYFLNLFKSNFIDFTHLGVTKMTYVLNVLYHFKEFVKH